MRLKKILFVVRRLAALLILLCLPSLSLGAPVPASSPQPPQLPALSGHLSVLEDRSTSLTLSDVLREEHQARFRQVQYRDINLGFTRSAVWVRLSLPSNANLAGILTIAPNFLDAVDIYSAPPGRGFSAGDYRHEQTGDHRAPMRNGISAFVDAVRLEFAAGQTTQVYIRILNLNSATQAHFDLGRVEDFASDLTTNTLAIGIWFGGMAVLIVVQGIFFFFDQKLQYPLLALRAVSIVLIYFGNLGLSRLLLFPENSTANDIFIGVCSWGALIVFPLTFIKLLELDEKSVWLCRLYLLHAVAGVVGVIFACLGRNLEFAPFGSTFSLWVVFLSAFISLWYAREDGVASMLRAVAFCILGIGSIVSIAQRIAVVDLPNWIFHIYGLSGLIHIVLLTGVLAIRLRDAERRERLTQAEALEAAQSAERIAAALVEERTGELVEARRAAENALQAEMQSQIQQVRFLEVLSHQYRTPLSAIRASADSVALALRKTDKANLDRIERIRRSVAWLVQILEVNLERSLMQRARLRPEPSSVTAGSIVTDAFKRAQDLLSNPDILLEIDSQASETELFADAAMIELAILNLLENAVKYTALRWHAAVTLSLTQNESGLVISVRDQGIGIPKADLPNVFQDGVRGSNAGAAEGSGLGLSLVARIVDSHGWTVDLDSVEGEETVVNIAIPRPKDKESLS